MSTIPQPAFGNQVPRGNSQFRTRSRTDQVLSSDLSAYRLPSDGRKQKLLCRDRRELLLYLAGYPAVFMGTKKMASAMGWSRRTVIYRLKDLLALNLIENHERVPGRWSYRRTLHPENLRGESCTPPRESCTQEVNTNHKTKSDEPDATRQTAPRSQRALKPPIATEPGRPAATTPQEHARRATGVLLRNGMDPEDAADTVLWILYRSIVAGGIANAPRSIRYYMRAARRLEYRDHQTTAMLLEAPDRLRKVAGHRFDQLIAELYPRLEAA